MPTKEVRGLTFHFPNEIEFKGIYEEVFKDNLYYADLETLAPRIIDCGAHIGVSVLYFKTTFPQAKIIAFEPEPTLFKYLQKNVDANFLTDVELIPKAVWKEDGVIDVYVDSQQENHWLSTTSIQPGAWNLRQETEPVMVAATRLSHYLDEPVDLLKLDIEGAETEVIKEIQPKLKNVRRLLIEFHANRVHRPEGLIKILKSNGFEVTAYFGGKELSLDRLTRRKPTLYLLDCYKK